VDQHVGILPADAGTSNTGRLGTHLGAAGADRRTRSLLNVAMLVALGKDTELAVHVKGAIKNGATEAEIQEAILQASIYAGLPAGLAGTRVADKALKELKDEKERHKCS